MQSRLYFYQLLRSAVCLLLKSSWDGGQIEQMGLDFSLFGLSLFCAKSALFSLVTKYKQSAVSCKKSGRIIAYCAVQKTIKNNKVAVSRLGSHHIVQQITTATFKSSRHAQKHPPPPAVRLVHRLKIPYNTMTWVFITLRGLICSF